jgi:phage tail sheath protein FI
MLQVTSARRVESRRVAYNKLMMPEYLAPGVYVEGTSFVHGPIAPSQTSIAAFVGATTKGPCTHLRAWRFAFRMEVCLRTSDVALYREQC